jgi:hypothetical protein
MDERNKTEKFYLTIFSYTISLFLGWQIFSFINIYFQSNENRIQFAFQQWMGIQYSYFPIITIILIIISFFVFTNKSFKQKIYPINYKAFRSLLIWLSVFIFGTSINYILFLFHSQQNILELMNLISAILSLNQLSKLFYVKEILTWYHPTTRSTFYLSVAFLGISQMLIMETLNFPFSGYAYFLLVLLTIEIFRIFTRFKYLTKMSYETNMIARSLLGKYGIYFGVRVMAGIFMPIVFILYALYVNEKLFQGVGVLIIIGEFIERLLFIYLSDYPTIKEN